MTARQEKYFLDLGLINTSLLVNPEKMLRREFFSFCKVRERSEESVHC